ncbi:hypothetical protein M084_3952 [Bacteroides fragilis str. 3988 T1]|nr:hypothetical protein M084_3952 [Bacteroides fragilis str. 3988 T1]
MVKVLKELGKKSQAIFSNNLKRYGNTIGFPHTLSKEEI